MKQKDSLYMQRCIQLAQLALGNTYPNPIVGSVIVYNDQIIGEGYHKKAGTPHAEINAINSVEDKSLIKESTIYVTLEPCAHYGKTPPCAEKIRELGFKKVVVGALDSHDKVNGKGIQMIKDAGIEVTTHMLENECRSINKRFFTFHEKKRPYIILKWAQSQDGFIDKDFHPFAISNKTVNQLSHLRRSQEHAILVGTTTALRDNPSLTVRHIEGRNPTRILLDFNLKVPTHYNLYNNEAETIILNSQKEGKIDRIKFVKLNQNHDLQEVMNLLYREQIQSLIVEGGAQLLNSFIQYNLWDEAVVITNKELQLANGTKAPNLPSHPSHEEIIENNIIQTFNNTQSL